MQVRRCQLPKGRNTHRRALAGMAKRSLSVPDTVRYSHYIYRVGSNSNTINTTRM